MRENTIFPYINLIQMGLFPLYFYGLHYDDGGGVSRQCLLHSLQASYIVQLVVLKYPAPRYIHRL